MDHLFTRSKDARLPGLLLCALALWAVNSLADQAPVAQFETVEARFFPEITLDTNVPFFWTWADNSISSAYPVASNASPGLQTLTIDPPSALTCINLGFDGSDSGWTNRFSLRDPQGVASVNFAYPLTNLQLWASSYNPITNTLDFSGFNALEDIECFHCTNVQQVIVSNLPSLKRVCFEDNDLQELDLSGNPNVEDVRGALNAMTEINVGGGTGPKIWHWCFRDNPQLEQHFQDIMTNFYSLKEPWFWRANQSGALKFVSSNLTDVELSGNYYTFADFSNQTNMIECLIDENRLTNLVVNNCTKLEWLDARKNHLPTAVVDSLLAFFDHPGRPIRILDLSDNTDYPSSSGYAHYTNLVNRGVNVHVDFPGAQSVNVSITVQSEPPGLPFKVDGVSHTSQQQFQWVAGSTHSISTIAAQSGTGTRYSWNGWSDSGAVSHLVAPGADTTYTASFTPQYSLKLTAGLGGQIDHASGWYDAGSAIPLSAVPNTGYSFVGWTGTGSGSISGGDNPGVVTMNGPISESATFSVSADVLNLSVTGQGTVSPNYNGQALQIGRRLTISAKPATGFLFSNWTGGVWPDSAVITNGSKLSCSMQSNLVLEANFVANPFVPLKGNFNGLFAENGPVQHASSGFLTLTLTDPGSYSGTMVIAGSRASLSGQFDLEGNSTKAIGSGSASPVTVRLKLDKTPGANQITGTVSNAAWAADLRAVHAGFDARTNPATGFASKYTLAIPGIDGDALKPAGNGYASLTMDRSGKLSLNGALADGTVLHQVVPISSAGDWPFYVSLYGGKGSIWGWLTITNRDSDDLHGQLTWTKPAIPNAKFYPAGFTNNDMSILGSIYISPLPSTRILNIANGLFTCGSGNLSTPFTNAITIGSDNKVANISPNKLTLGFNTSSGLLGGSVTPPGGTTSFPFKGVVLQKQNSGSGFSLGANQSGRVLLVPVP